MTFDARRFLETVSESPGIYRMFDDQSNTLYIGKARRLKARLASYFRGALNTKTQALVARIHDIQVTVTNSERPLLALNILFPKQVPCLLCSSNHLVTVNQC